MACNCKPKPKPQRSILAAIAAALVLVLLPKCPLCFVGYAAFFGIGLSFSAAATLRLLIIIACVVALVLAIVRLVRR